MNKFNISRRDLIKGTVLLTLSATDITAARAGTLTVSSVLGRPTSNSITVNLVCAQDVNGFIEYGFSANNLNLKTESKNLIASQPSEFLLENLKPNSKFKIQNQQLILTKEGKLFADGIAADLFFDQ